MRQILDPLIHLHPAAIYTIAALLACAETATLLGLVLPGELTLLFVGFLCYGGKLELAVALPIMLVAGLVGDNLAYLAGRRLGPRLRTSGLGRRVGERRWARAEARFRRYGGRAVCIARFVGFARTLTPRLAGTAGMPYRRFLPWNAVGVVGCIVGTVLIGYLAGDSYDQVVGVFGQASGALLLLVLVIIAMVLLGRYLGRHPDPVAAVGVRLLGWPPVAWLGRAYQRGFATLSARMGVGGAVAANVLGGVLVLLAVGYGLSWAIERLVRQSGLPLIDPLVVHWMTTRRDPRALSLARDTLWVLRGSYLVILVAVVALTLYWRSRAWRSDLVGVLGSIGAFVPLLILGLAADWVGGPASEPVTTALPNQTAIVTASLGMLAWLASRRRSWALGVAAWLTAVAGSLLAGLARAYLGWSWPSELVASMLLGWLWVLVFVIAWHTRDRAGGARRAGRASAGAVDGAGGADSAWGADRAGGADGGEGVDRTDGAGGAGGEDPGLPSASPSLAVSPSPSKHPSPTPRRSTATKPQPKASHKAVSMAKPPEPPAPPAGCAVTRTGTAAPRSAVLSALTSAAALRPWQSTNPITPEIGVPLSLVEAVAWQESGWQSNVKSCIGAIGLMQLVPATADWMNQRFGDHYDLNSVNGNAALGSIHLQWLIKYFGDVYFGGNYELAPGTRDNPSLLDAVLAAYNVGYGNVDTTIVTDSGRQSVLKIPNWGYVGNVEALMTSKPWNG